MKLAICSDLHLEFQDINLENTESADVLILGGDILVAEDLYNHQEPIVGPNLGSRQEAAIRFRAFLRRCSDAFPHVVYIAGNHELYHGKWLRSIETLRDECSKLPNVHFLERDIWKHDDWTFIGATLWTDCNKGDPLTLHALQDMMNDYRVIRNEESGFTPLRPAHTMHRHQETVGYIRAVVQDRDSEKFVMVGHHSPSHRSIHETYADDKIMNGGYHSDLSEFILDHPQIKLWTHGHTHFPFDYTIGETRIVCNPRGYSGWDPMADHFQLKFIDI